MLKPLADGVYFIVKRTLRQTNSGLYLPASSETKGGEGVVVAVGAGVKEVKKGDKIIFPQEAKSLVFIKEDSGKYYYIKEEDILAIVA